MSKHNTDASHMISAKQLAEVWETSPTTVRRILEEAGVPVYRLSRRFGGTVRYLAADIDRFMAESRICPEAMCCGATGDHFGHPNALS